MSSLYTSVTGKDTIPRGSLLQTNLNPRKTARLLLLVYYTYYYYYTTNIYISKLALASESV